MLERAGEAKEASEMALSSADRKVQLAEQRVAELEHGAKGLHNMAEAADENARAAKRKEYEAYPSQSQSQAPSPKLPSTTKPKTKPKVF